MTNARDADRQDDSASVKVTTRLPKGQARQMRVEAMQQGITIESAYMNAVEAFLRASQKTVRLWHSGVLASWQRWIGRRRLNFAHLA